MLDAFATRDLGSKIVEPLIVLILKVDHLSYFRDLRLVILCNVVYKIIPKVLVNPLCPFLDFDWSS